MGALGTPVKFLLNVRVAVLGGAQQCHRKFQGLLKVTSWGIGFYLSFTSQPVSSCSLSEHNFPSLQGEVRNEDISWSGVRVRIYVR